MKFLVLIVCSSFLFGCTSTTIKSYSTDFKVYPVETKDVGKIFSTSDETNYTIKQQYKFEGIITETTHFSDGKTTALEIKTPIIQTQLGNEAKTRIKTVSNNGDLNNEEICLEVLLEENDNETRAFLKALYKKHDLKPVISMQHLTIKKMSGPAA